MPDDGFATDNVLGISKAFEKFLNPLMDNEAAYISVLPDPSPRWDIYLYPDHIDPATHLTAKITKVTFWMEILEQLCCLYPVVTEYEFITYWRPDFFFFYRIRSKYVFFRFCFLILILEMNVFLSRLIFLDQYIDVLAKFGIFT